MLLYLEYINIFVSDVAKKVIAKAIIDRNDVFISSINRMPQKNIGMTINNRLNHLFLIGTLS
ncbi:MAG: hypothetical protein ACTSRP_16750 [Candidatus Helarchaeota archaeon]